MTKYLVVGSPGKYRLQAVRPGGTDYDSGMTREAAEKTRIALNAKYFKEKEQEPPIEAVTPDESKLELNEEKVKEFYEIFTENFYPPTAVGKALADPTKTLAENIGQAFEAGSNNVDTSGDWILISKKLYEGPGIVSKITNTGAITTTPNTLLWYNTQSGNTRPANEVPESAIINNQPIKENALGVAGNVSNETFDIWTEANKETIINEELGVTRDSSLIELQAAAKKEGITIPAFADKLSSEDQRNILYDLIRAKKDVQITDAIELAKSKISIGNVNVVTPEVENKTSSEAQAYINAYQVTLYKGTETKNVDVRAAQNWINKGWSTEKPTTANIAEDIVEIYLVTIYKDGNSKQVDKRDLQNWIDQGWSTTAPTELEINEDVDEYGYTPSDYKNGIAIYRKDAPAGGERVFSFADLKKALSEGYFLQPVELDGTGPIPGQGLGQQGNGQITNTAITDFNNIPENGLLWNVNGQNYIVYEVPGANGELYDGNPIYMAYEVKDNDLISAGILSPESNVPQPNATMDKAFFDSIAIVTGNTDQLSADIDNPFASFVETIGEQAQVAPWITDPEMIALIAEAAVEGREISDAEWQTTNWYQTHNESEREWLRTYYADPSTATQLTTDAQIAVANSLQAAGVSNAPEALINWVAGKFVSGEWSQTYTTEQISLFADPYATGKRDVQFENYLSSTALTGVDRTTEREREVQELYTKWLGPTLGKLTDKEKAEIAGRLRDDPDYQDQLVQSLKQSRLAAFSNYTNPELTYEDIARPWRNLTASVWGQTADETQGWWQEMMKSNDFAKAQNTLREKGLELDITQVTQDATQALQQALGQGSVSQTGVNV